MGRPPCCDKIGVKKGPWTPEEDIILVTYIQVHGAGNWSAVPTVTGLLRCGKSCRLRWTNNLRPGIKKGSFTDEEKKLIIHLQALLGNRWAAIASYLPERTDNDIKNYWNTQLKKDLRKLQPECGGGSWASALQSTTHQPMAKQALCGLKQTSSSASFSSVGYNSVLTQCGSQGESLKQASPSIAVYASSTENISRLLQGWMRNTPKSHGGGGTAVTCSFSDLTQHPSDNTASSSASYSASSERVVSPKALESLLPWFEDQALSAPPEAASETSLIHEENKPTPFWLLEKWLLEC